MRYFKKFYACTTLPGAGEAVVGAAGDGVGGAVVGAAVVGGGGAVVGAIVVGAAVVDRYYN